MIYIKVFRVVVNWNFEIRRGLKMRKFVASVRYFRPVFQHQGACGMVKRPNFLVDTYSQSLYKQSYNVTILLGGHPSSMITRAPFTNEAQPTTGGMALRWFLGFFQRSKIGLLHKVLSFCLFCIINCTELNKAGPLVEYERRISAGELVDGDVCQVWQLICSTLMEWK